MSGCRQSRTPGCRSPARGRPHRDAELSPTWGKLTVQACVTHAIVAIRAEHISSVWQCRIVALRASVLGVQRILRPVDRVDALPDVDLTALIVLRHTAECP